ncbi:MAG: PAS domain S-box protein [Desulfobacteraceae bacterium]|uniref:PAS domain S-box protein n=1 Tax=Candidatus Desulfacyla euxinica TaxID=2841693 RepID=A0A8J6N2Z8_9DELT|nr:PAS domain S-box protein [Candidatus Desulfacyla euxinica]MBL6977626.1 PAS domain S-box protein [Desulfobacteraceae bacterium]MBL7216213.1 PAS domain S-box protein [Desulfobacteraceae bacterium]
MPETVNQKLSILLIEDNPGDARLIQEMIHEGGDTSFDLVHAERLSAGLEIVAGGDIDIILLDLSLPDSHGLDTVVRTLNQTPDIPIVVLTGLRDEELANEFVRLGAQDYLYKEHIDPDILTRVIRYAVYRKEIERELQRSEVRFRVLIEQNADGILVMDKRGIILLVNRAVEALFGRGPEDLIGTHCGLPIVKGRESSEIDIVGGDGKEKVAAVRVEEIEWKGEPAYLASLRDVTARKQMEDELRRTVEKLEEANQKILEQQESVMEEERLKVLLQMAGATAHELNQPLMVLLGNIELMRMKKNTPERFERYMDTIEEAGKHMSRIVKKIQHIRHAETKDYLNGRSIIDLNQEEGGRS